MKEFLKKYKRWSLPSKMTFWGLIFGIVSTPSVIIGYFQFFGNDDIANKLYKALQVNSRAYLQVKDVSVPNYDKDGKVLMLKIENISNFWAKNIKTVVYPASKIELKGKFNNIVLSNKNLGIPPKTVSDIAVLPFEQLKNVILKEYPKKKIVDIRLLNRPSNVIGRSYSFPFIVNISYLTEGGENISKTVVLKVILK